MNALAEVRLWGRTIGAVSLEEGNDVAAFEYDPAFAGSGIEISPLCMPLSDRVYSFPELSQQTFYGLPGLLADSLPDKFGHALINAWLAARGRQSGSFNAVERLCYTGERGMGALEFVPAIGPKMRRASEIQIDKLVELASQVLTHRTDLRASFAGQADDKSKEQALTDILRVGTSAGGARAKAVIAWNPSTNEVRSGQVPAGQGFEYWLLKFDGVRGNKDKELEDPQGYGVIEYAYSRMAKDCGISIGECRLFEENGRRHFMTRRFDRLADGRKLHRQLELPMSTVEEQFRRMVFNIVARNQDDHVKNIAFLMNKSGQWSLSPAFDVTYSFNPAAGVPRRSLPKYRPVYRGGKHMPMRQGCRLRGRKRSTAHSGCGISERRFRRQILINRRSGFQPRNARYRSQHSS